MLKCNSCNSKDIQKRGYRYNKSGKKQKYRCLKCGCWFVEDDGFKRMRNKPKIIARAIHMHNDGMSFADIKNHLWQYDNIKVSREAVRKWHKKYSLFLKSDTSQSKTRIKRSSALWWKIYQGQRRGSLWFELYR